MPLVEQMLYQNMSSVSVANFSTNTSYFNSTSTNSSSTSNAPNSFASSSSSSAATANGNFSASLNKSQYECVEEQSELHPSMFGVLLAVPEWEAIATAVVLSVIIVLTIVGNILVILSVFTYKPLRIVQNFFIVSLAVADLTVALLVLPFNVAYSILGRWEFGIHLCKMWLTCDVMCCTSSILNLCAIALDRYWAITDPINYAQKRTVGRVLMLIAGVWILSLLISSPPLVGWNDWPEKFTSNTPCELTSNRGYVIYSSLGSFFMPLAIMTIVYIEIYIATRRRLRERAQASKINTIAIKAGDASTATTATTTDKSAGGGGWRAFVTNSCCCCLKDGSNIATPIIQPDQESISSETNVNVNINNEARVVVVTSTTTAGGGSSSSCQKKSRRAKIKDSIKHGKLRSKKLSTPPLKNDAGHTAADRLLLPQTPKDTRSMPHDTPLEHYENSSESGAQPHSSGGDATDRLNDVDDADTVDEENVSLKITPPQSSTGGGGGTLSSLTATPLQKKPTGVYQFIEEKQKISLSKERRAARTLGIIMGVFVICWLPFFLMYVILPFCESCCPTNKFKNFITWLGYINSGLNPVIYTIFNLDYRRAFKRLLGINC